MVGAVHVKVAESVTAPLTVTVALCAAEPPVPVQVKAYVVSVVRAWVECEPLVGSAPVHAPEAVHDVALVEDQARVEAPPLVTLDGLALSVTMGAGAATVTLADWAAEPPVPLQFNVYLVVAVTAPVLREPLVDSLPLQPPEAVQEVAWVVDHVRVALAPFATVLGLALKAMVGAGGVTDTVTDCLALPPVPLQSKV